MGPIHLQTFICRHPLFSLRECKDVCLAMVSAETLVLANVRWYKSSMLLAQIVNQTAHSVTQTGIGLGAAIAVVCSWQRNRSIVWAILAGLLSWIYVIYFAITREPDETK